MTGRNANRFDHKHQLGFMLVVLIAFALNGSGASGQTADSTKLSGTANDAVLKGNASDEGHMNPSVTLMVNPPPKPSVPLIQPHVSQFSGAQPYSPGKSAPPLPPPPPPPATVHALQANQTTMFRMPPPILPYSSLRPAPAPRWNYSITPRNGVMTWEPGYATQAMPQAPHPRLYANWSAPRTQLQFSSQRTNMQYAPQAEAPVELKATEKILPGLNTAPPVYKNWNDWYQHVAQAIYERWKIATVGPGKATMEVTVSPAHNVDCKLVQFDPAPDVKRDAKTESEFRQAAVFAMNSLSGDLVWEFPQNVEHPKKVVFDIDMEHAVGQQPGCRVVHRHAER